MIDRAPCLAVSVDKPDSPEIAAYTGELPKPLAVTGAVGKGPKALNFRVSAQMRRMPRASTKLEVQLRRDLHARGLRFRIQGRGLPGTPDVVLSRARVAVFVDGCFWHGCDEHGVVPKNNREWWISKLAKNAERDLRKDRELAELGWVSLHFWEHTPVVQMADEIVEVWRVRTNRS